MPKGGNAGKGKSGTAPGRNKGVLVDLGNKGLPVPNSPFSSIPSPLNGWQSPFIQLGSAAGGGGGGGAPPLTPAHWYDFSDSGTLTLSGSEITGVADKGSVGGDLVSFSGTTYPATTTLNGRGAADFDGSDILYADTVAADISVTDAPLTIALAAQFSVIAATIDFCSFSSQSSNTPKCILGFQSPGKWRIQTTGNTSTPNNIINSTPNADTDPHVIIAVFHGTTVTFYVDGSSVPLGSTNVDVDARVWNRFNIGARRSVAGVTAYATGVIGEVLVYTSALAGDDLTNLHSYLAGRWS